VYIERKGERRLKMMKVNLEELRAQLFGPPLSQQAIARFLILSLFSSVQYDGVNSRMRMA